MDMIERVARALAEAEGIDDGLRFERMARAAIEAMREPTEAMKHATEEIHWGYSCGVCGGLTEGWYALIDAALVTTPSKL